MLRRTGRGASFLSDKRGWRVLSALAIAVPVVIGVITAAATLVGRLNLNVGGWLTVAAAIAAAVQPAARAVGRWAARWREQRSLESAEQRQLRSELDGLITYCGAVREVGMQHLGVAPSRPGETAYVHRQADAELQELLRTQRFVLVTGASSAGKSRTALQAALAIYPEAMLIVPVRNAVRATTMERALELVRALGMLDGAASKPVLLWLDDLEQYVDAEALTTDLLARWSRQSPPIVVLATMQEQRWAIRRFPPPSEGNESDEAGADSAAEILRLATRVPLPKLLTTTEEMTEATRRYGAWNWNRLGLGEVLSRGRDLLEKLEAGRRSNPRGAAIVVAAMAWRRAGVGRLISHAELRGLSELYIPDLVGRRETFDDGLRWACSPLPGSDIRLLVPRYGETEYYEPHDYVVGDRERHNDPISARTWDWIIECESLTHADVVQVGTAAYDAGAHRAAERAFAKAAAAADSAVAARALNARGVALWQLGRSEEALEAWREVERLYGQDQNPAVRQRVAMAMRNQGVSLRDRRHDDSVRILDEVVTRYGQDTESSILVQVAHALLNKASSLKDHARYEEAIAAYEEVERRFANATEPELRAEVARAMDRRALVLGQLGRREEEIAVCAEVERRFATATEPELRSQVARAMYERALALGQLERWEGAISVCEEAERRFANATEPDARIQLVWTMDHHAWALGQLGRRDEGIAVYEELEQRFANADANELMVRVEVARALVQRAVQLEVVDRFDEAIAICQAVDRRFGEATEPELRREVARALRRRGYVLWGQERFDDAMVVYEEIEQRRFSDDPDPELRDIARWARSSMAYRLGMLGQADAAISLYEEVERRYAADADSASRSGLAWTLRDKGVTLLRLNRTEEGIATLEDLDRRLGHDSDPHVQEAVALALARRADWLREVGRLAEALAAYKEIESRFTNAAEQSLREQVGLARSNIEQLTPPDPKP